MDLDNKPTELSSDYIHLLCDSLPDKKKRIKKWDSDNILEQSLLPKISSYRITVKDEIPTQENKSLINDDIYLSLQLIQYKSDIRVNIFDLLSTKYEPEWKYILTYIISNYSSGASNIYEKEITIQFLILCCHYFDIKCIQQSLLRICSIFAWVNLSKSTLKRLLLHDVSLWKKFAAWGKWNKIDNNTIKQVHCTFIIDLIQSLWSNWEDNDNTTNTSSLNMSIISLLIELLSWKQTRKFLLPWLQELHSIERLNIVFQTMTSNTLMIQMYKILEFYYFFDYDLHLNSFQDKISTLQESYNNWYIMQSTAYSLFPEELSQILTENTSLSNSRENWNKIISSLTHDQILTLLSNLSWVTLPYEFYDNRTNWWIEIFITKYEKRENIFGKLISHPLYPNEDLLYDDTYISDNPSVLNNRPIPLPKWNWTYLTVYDYLWKCFLLYKYESAYEIKYDVKDTVNRMYPLFENGKFKTFEGWSIYGIPIIHYDLLTVKDALIGQEYPKEVLGEIEINWNGIQTEIKHQWDAVKKYESLFWVSLREDGKHIIRGGEVCMIYDEDNKNIIALNEDKIPLGFKRRIIVKLDSVQYSVDLQKGENIKFNLLIRREAKSNNFRSILEAVKDSLHNVKDIPKWIEDAILGNNTWIDNQTPKEDKRRKRRIDLLDTFISSEHYNQYINDSNDKAYSSWYSKQSKSSKWSSSSTNFKRNKIPFTNNQISVIKDAWNNGLTLIVGPPGTGKTDVAVQIINLLYHNNPNEKIVIWTHSNTALNDIFEKISLLNIDQQYLLRLGMGSKSIKSDIDYSLTGRINYWLSKREALLSRILEIAHNNNIFIYEQYTCDTAKTMIENFWLPNKEKVEAQSPNINLTDILKEWNELHILELLRDNKERNNYWITNHCKIIAMTCTYAALNRKHFLDIDFKFNSLVMEESAQISEIESFIPLTIQKDINNIARIIMWGDQNQLLPIVKNNFYKTFWYWDISLFTRWIRNNNKHHILSTQGRSRKEIVDLYRWKYPYLTDIETVQSGFPLINKGFAFNWQFINVNDYDNKGEEMNGEMSFYNWSEAEYSIGVYMYMCLQGYQPRAISIITTYMGQCELIKEIYNKKCSWSTLFKGIGKISTVDKYQGQQNDFIILSMVRSKNIGYIRDVRRLIVSISRARQGLYIWGRYDWFKNCLELKETMDLFNGKERKLKLVIKESANKEDENINAVEIEDFRHMFRVVQGIWETKKI